MHWRSVGRAFAWLVLAATVGPSATSCRETRELPACVEPAPPGGRTLETTDGDPVLVGAGDISEPNPVGAEATAKLLDGIDGQVVTFGDNAYVNATLDNLVDSYGSTWGRHRWRTRPAIGNHEYHSPHAAPYFAYFCEAAGAPFQGYYSYDIGSWHVVVLNSQCAEDDGYGGGPACDAGSEQARWLRADLAAHPSRCTAAYWHHPRFSSGGHSDHPAMRDLWTLLADANAELVLSGHDHAYERFAPMDADGVADPERGMRQIVVGTGGARHNPFKAPRANSEVRVADEWGVIKLTLHAESYDWEFINVDHVLRDSGRGRCH
ncbi:hypothetical protein BH11MYX4_BH11MYX4_15650 [soil metagenome]